MARANSQPPTLKGFTYLRQLGSGGFSDVYLYEQALPRRSVAVKVLDELTADNRASFAAEANLMAQLSAHPYIVSIHHADVSDDGRPFFIMEYCSGPSLADRYKRQPLSVTEALRTGIRISSAIATAHASGILHRDIKPGNVLTNEYGSPLLTDFGISSMVEDELVTHTTTLAALTGSGATTGSQSVGLSIPWSPPEMFDDDPKPDVRSDLFSLSATIWTLLAGRTPFEVLGKSNQSIELMGRIERGAITPMDRSDVPPSFIAALRKGMAVDRSQRYATAVDFARALQAIELSLSYAPTPIDVPNVNQVEAPVHPTGDGDHADRTRARGVTPVIAQPARPIAASLAKEPVDRTRVRGATVILPEPSGATARGASASPVIESTVVRSSAPSVVQPDAIDTNVPETNLASRRGAIFAVIGGLMVVAVVVGGIALFAPRGESRIGTQPQTTGAPLDVGTVVPTPVLASVTPAPDGQSVSFIWTNPDLAAGDTYVWQRTDGAGEDGVTPTSGTTATVTGVSPGTKVCVSVSVVRSGETSPNPLKACTS